jgi:hypothetical protein
MRINTMADSDVSFVRLGPFDDPVATFDFDSFLAGAQSLGLPVTTLRRLRDRGWKCKVDPDRTESLTTDNALQDWWYG